MDRQERGSCRAEVLDCGQPLRLGRDDVGPAERHPREALVQRMGVDAVITAVVGGVVVDGVQSGPRFGSCSGDHLLGQPGWRQYSSSWCRRARPANWAGSACLTALTNWTAIVDKCAARLRSEHHLQVLLLDQGRELVDPRLIEHEDTARQRVRGGVEPEVVGRLAAEAGSACGDCRRRGRSARMTGVKRRSLGLRRPAARCTRSRARRTSAGSARWRTLQRARSPAGRLGDRRPAPWRWARAAMPPTTPMPTHAERQARERLGDGARHGVGGDRRETNVRLPPGARRGGHLLRPIFRNTASQSIDS